MPRAKRDMRKNKTVFDTNIWVSYFITGRLTELVEMLLNKKVILFRSDELTQELTEVMLRSKIKKYFPLGVDRHLAFYERITILLQDGGKIQRLYRCKRQFFV